MTVHQPGTAFAHGTVADAPAPLSGSDTRDLLRFITCGSVDDGKSTLIGRLLYETNHLFDDQVEALERDSRKLGTQNGALDLALAVDGLAAEREQGITIDVAYRFFSTARRSFIVADTPGHEQYTRNMATGASTADLAILLVDARKGLSRQTRRHSLLLSMLGVRSVVVAINKMDLVGWDRATFESVMAEYREFAAGLGFGDVTGIPLSALTGANVAARAGTAAAWYQGPSLLEHLETVAVGPRAQADAFRLPIQWVNRPNLDFRGFAGTVTGGPVLVGQTVRIVPSGETTTVARIVTYDGDLPQAEPGQAVTLTLADEVDASRGAQIVAADAVPLVRDRFDARLFWMARAPVRDGASLLLKMGTQVVPVTVACVHARTDLHTLDEETVTALEVNDVGVVTLQADRPVAFDPYAANRDTGSLILIDRESFDTVAMGLALEHGPGSPVRAATAETAALLPSLDPSVTAWLGRPIESVWRSLAKTVSWRLVGTLLTLLVAFVLTQDLRVALAVGAGDLIVKLALFFGHERLWARIGLGLRPGAPPGPARH